MTTGHVLPVDVLLTSEAPASPERSRKAKAMAQRMRPAIMMGTERRRMRRRPMRSMEWNATRVKAKFVRAMEREVRVGEWKPTRRKMVAEKYIMEFWWDVSCRA